MKLPEIDDSEYMVACPDCHTPFTEFPDVAAGGSPLTATIDLICIDGHRFMIHYANREGSVWMRVIPMDVTVVPKEPPYKE